VERSYIGRAKFYREDILNGIDSICVPRQSVFIDYRRFSAATNDGDISIPQSALDKCVTGPSQDNERISLRREPLKQHPVVVVTSD
jgi:hypothetical protein